MKPETKDKLQNVLLIFLLGITFVAALITLYFSFYHHTYISNF